MARDRANIRTDIWNDDDFRRLSAQAQLLYLQLLTSATLTYAGVADWRPKRIAALAAGRTPKQTEDAARELVNGLFVVIDDETEEVLIRSFLKHDGLLQKPNVAKAMVTAYGQVYSMTLKGVIVHELQRIHEKYPEWRGFVVGEVQALLRNRSVNPSELIAKGSGKGSQKKASLLTTTTATDYSLPAIEERSLESWFEQGYTYWPKKTERKKSLAKFTELAKKHDPSWLVDQITRFGNAYALSTEKRFVPALVVWLNGERWNDELPAADTQTINAQWDAAMSESKPDPCAGGHKWAADESCVRYPCPARREK